MTEPAIRVTDVDKIFPVPFRRRRIVALQNLSLKIAAGEVYGLLGPNGSGKSTTLKIILGLLQPTHGSVSIFGRDNSAVAVRREIGFLPENAYFHKFLTGTETLRFHARLSGMSGTATKSRITDLLATVGLTRAADARLATYSKGMLQRIGLAQALIHDPKILILDEPTAAVDPAGSRDIQNLIVSLKKRGTTILLSSHLLTQVQEVCDRVGILAQGALVREGATNDFFVRSDCCNRAHDFYRVGPLARFLRARAFRARSNYQRFFPCAYFLSTGVAGDTRHRARCDQFFPQHARDRRHCPTVAAGSRGSCCLQRARETGTAFRIFARQILWGAHAFGGVARCHEHSLPCRNSSAGRIGCSGHNAAIVRIAF